jgi:hypothetical protein
MLFFRACECMLPTWLCALETTHGSGTCFLAGPSRRVWKAGLVPRLLHSADILWASLRAGCAVSLGQVTGAHVLV